MFALTAFAYPLLLAALCIGAGLLVSRLAGDWLPAPLLAVVGAAALIGVSQLSTYIVALAPATPFLVAALAVSGFALSRARVTGLARAARAQPWLPAAAVLTYVIALAPVLAAGRASFSSYLALADSAVHMIGADYLIQHGQSFAHLDLSNSYGQFINDYYNAAYPSGADTLFGASAWLLGLRLIWAFQPFNAFMLALATGPAWMLARGAGLGPRLAALASLTMALGAIDYAYELLGSVKEVSSLALILALGALAVAHRRWLFTRARAALPFALLVAAGFSTLGAAFGAWALVACAVPGAAALARLRRERAAARGLAGTAALGAAVVLVAAWPTWRQLSGSLRLAQAISSTSNSGNLHTPLRAEQVFGVWLRGSYKLSPAGASLTATHVLIALLFALALLGAVQLLRARAFALAGWIACMLLAWLAVSHAVTTWAGAKTLMLTSPAVLLLSWAGIAALARTRASARRGAGLRALAAGSLALAFAGAVLASDALQYHSSNLAPTARYEELASLNERFAGRGPVLFTDFDEWSMYVLRDLDVGGPDFVYPPPALAAIAGGYGDPVQLERARAPSLASYPLIITRRDPAAARPPAAYALAWRGRYYEAWRRPPGASSATRHIALPSSPAGDCARIGALASQARSATARVVAARAPVLVAVPLAHSPHPLRWGHQRGALVMGAAGTLRASVTLPDTGEWLLWVKGQLMPQVTLTIDGQPLGRVAGELGGNSLVLDAAAPLRARLHAGVHTLSVTRRTRPLAPGDGGAAVLGALLFTPAGVPGDEALVQAPARAWHSLCGSRYRWAELSES